MKKYVGMLVAVFCLAFVGQSIGALVDPGFEANDLNVGWGFFGGGLSLAAETGPSSAVGDSLSVSMAITGGYEQIVSKAVPVAFGDTVNLTIDYKQLTGGTGNLQAQIKFYNGVGANGFSEGGGGTFQGEYTATLPTSVDVWNTISTGPLANSWPAADYVEIRLIGNAFTGLSGTVLADNVDVSVIPEPATLSLMALVGGALVASRRMFP